MEKKPPAPSATERGSFTLLLRKTSAQARIEGLDPRNWDDVVDDYAVIDGDTKVGRIYRVEKAAGLTVAAVEAMSSTDAAITVERVNGKLELVQVQLEPSLLEQRDVEMLQDLVVAAVNEGIRAAQRMVADEMGKLTGGLGLKLPGMP